MQDTPYFVIVYYCWWMDKGYFEEEVIRQKSREEVEQYAAAKCHNNQTTFRHWDYRVVEASVKIVTELIPRKLTWWERLTGLVS